MWYVGCKLGIALLITLEPSNIPRDRSIPWRSAQEAEMDHQARVLGVFVA